MELGLDKLGYVYVNLDDCWQLVERDASDHVQVNSTKFPSGMKALGDYIHSKGLKFGIYSAAGPFTCQGKAGSLDYEEIDAADYATWGVDYFKYDNCANFGRSSYERYPKMRDALQKTGRPIFYSICNWGEDEIWKWGNTTGNSWRTSGDITATWGSVKENFLRVLTRAESAGPGAWNDPDMLEVGVGTDLTYTEQKSHFAMWCFMRSPLIFAMDLSKASEQTLKIIKTEGLIAVNQDSLG